MPASCRPKQRGLALLAAFCLTIAAPARAEDEFENALGVDVHAFVSQGFVLSSENNYLAKSKRGSFEFTEVGINFTKNLGDRLSVGMQLFSRDLGPIGNYKPQFDWFYLDYRFFDWLGLRAGRTKLPFGLYNEQSDIDQARVPVLLPQSVYPIANRDVLLAQTGVELYGYVPLGGFGAFDYRAYGGTIFFDSTTLASPSVTVTDIDVPYLVGGRAMWHTPLDGLRVGASVQALEIDLEFRIDPAALAGLQAANQFPADFDGNFDYELPYLLWVGSVEYAAHDVLLAAEYSRWRVDYTVRPPLVPDGDLTATRWYVMGSYRAASWFSPGMYYSLSQSGAPGPNTREKYQQDFAVTARYDIVEDHWLVKLEGHYMRGTGALSAVLNAGQDPATLPRDWGVFLVKTTAYF
ncbi:MAG TPA: hypothetical protein VGK73_39875 [Polyangiaceae bacterium]